MNSEQSMPDKPWQLAAHFVANRIQRFKTSDNDSKVRATLAKLRKGVAESPASSPELWEITLADLPEALLSNANNGEPTKGEWAVHLALSLFALHQQGKDIKSQCMHQTTEKTQSHALGSAIRTLTLTHEEEAVRRRFNMLATSSGIEEFAHHLRSMVQLLKASNTPLDYKQLTQDLYLFQIPDMRDNLRLRWGQDYYRFTKSE